MGKLGGVLGLNHLKKNYGDGITEEDFSTTIKKVEKPVEKKEVKNNTVTAKIKKVDNNPTSRKNSIKKKEVKKATKIADGAGARISARISEDFDREISLYCIENSVKKVDLAKEALSRIVNIEDAFVSLKGDNCKVSVTKDDKFKVLSFRVDEDLKKAVRKYVYQVQLNDPDASENYVLAQAIADYIGYKRKMRFN